MRGRRLILLLVIFIMVITTVVMPGDNKVITKMKQNSSGADVVIEAKKYVGNPYADGGSSLTDGCDCSHFVWKVYQKFDKSIGYVVSGSFYGRGGDWEKVSGVSAISNIKDNGKAGDVICWDGHVGIYDGQGGMIHAAGKKWGIVHSKSISSNHTFMGLARNTKLLQNVSLDEAKINSSSKNGHDGDSGATEAQRKKAQQSLGLTDKAVKEIQAGWNAAITDGYSDEACAGIWGNAQQECHCNPEVAESGGGQGVGLFQWSNGGQKALEDYSKKCGHKTKSLNGYNVCVKRGCQFSLMLEQMAAKGGYRSSSGPGKYNEYSKDFKGVKKGTHGIDVDPSELPSSCTDLPTIKKFKNCSDTASSAINFFCRYEVGAGVNYYSHRDMDRVGQYSHGKTDAFFFCHEHVVRPKYAKKFLTLFGSGGSSDPSKSADTETAQDISKNLVGSGYWDESKFVSYNKMNETQLHWDELSTFTDDELYNYRAWEEDVSGEGIIGTIITRSRWLTMIAGILIIVWMVLLYLAYWFDIINNFLDIELTPIFSFNKLQAVDSDEDATFHSKGKVSRGEKRTINSRQIAIVCLVGVCFGIVIISGVIYRIIYSMITLGQNIINKFF